MNRTTFLFERLSLPMNLTTFSFARLSLTPALSRWERANRRQMAWNGERSERFRGSMRDVLRGDLTPAFSPGRSGIILR
jgi:hypothetical protein